MNSFVTIEDLVASVVLVMGHYEDYYFLAFTMIISLFLALGIKKLFLSEMS